MKKSRKNIPSIFILRNVESRPDFDAEFEYDTSSLKTSRFFIENRTLSRDFTMEFKSSSKNM